jgi:hypothetical protein
MMNNIFQDLILSGDVMVYLDDILIAHSDITQHREIVQEVLRRLREHKLFLRLEKCEFKKTSIEYLWEWAAIVPSLISLSMLIDAAPPPNGNAGTPWAFKGSFPQI